MHQPPSVLPYGDDQFEAVRALFAASLTELEVPGDAVDALTAALCADRDKAVAARAAEEAVARAAEASSRENQAETKKNDAPATQSIRVNVDLLENLMTMVSELVLSRNQLLQMVRQYEDSEETDTSMRVP